ncbi:MAG: aldo/keto reductase [Nitrospirae bacterium]|nr:aldo/keto reductase [Nitrospirota bacterium]
MRYRRLGRTGFQVSEIGFGAWGIGGSFWIGAQDAESLAALHAAIDAGVNFIDTALVYGDGHSETLVGQVVRARSERIYVASKVPPLNGHWPALPDDRVPDAFPPSHIIKSTEKSLRSLKLDCLDLQQLHVWRDEWLRDESWLQALLKLKADGKIRAIGVSINDHEPESALKLVRSELIDAVQVIYNIFDQSPAQALFPACRQHDVGVLARCPFDEGGLTGTITPETTFPVSDWRNDYFKGDRKAQVAEHVASLMGLLGPEAHTLPELALRFCLAHSAVSTVLPGMRTQAHVRANVAVSDGRRLSDTLLASLECHAWQRNFYD